MMMIMNDNDDNDVDDDDDDASPVPGATDHELPRPDHPDTVHAGVVRVGAHRGAHTERTGALLRAPQRAFLLPRDARLCPAEHSRLPIGRSLHSRTLIGQDLHSRCLIDSRLPIGRVIDLVLPCRHLIGRDIKHRLLIGRGVYAWSLIGCERHSWILAWPSPGDPDPPGLVIAGKDPELDADLGESMN